MKAHTLTSKEFFIRTFMVWPRASVGIYIMITARDSLLKLLSSFQSHQMQRVGVAEGILNKVIYKSAAANKFYDDGSEYKRPTTF